MLYIMLLKLLKLENQLKVKLTGKEDGTTCSNTQGSI